MKAFLILSVVCMLATTADTWVNPHPEVNRSFDKVDQAVQHIDSLGLVYDDVTDDNITAAILETADVLSLSDDELQAVVDHYAD